jgi:nucleoside 2-deoxyribosyltransferase
MHMPTKIFVASPIGSEGSPQRRRSDQLLKHIIGPVADELGCDVVRADKLAEPGRITLQIANELGSADVVIADLSDLNPNVMYELGARQGLGRPYVLMAEDGMSLPFDLLDFRTIFYRLDLDGVDAAKEQLRAQLQAALDGKGSIVNRSIFSVSESTIDPGPTSATDQRLLLVLEAIGHLSRETEETKDSLQAMATVLSDLVEDRREAKQIAEEQRNQELGKWLFSQMLQNPEGADSVIAAVQTFANFSETPVQQARAASSQPKKVNRQTRRQAQREGKEGEE